MTDTIRESAPVARFTAGDLHRFGRRLAALREVAGFKQRALGRRIGLRPSRLSRIERGLVWPRLDELVLLSRALGRSLDDLVFGEAPPRDEILRALLAEITPEELQGFSRVVQVLVAAPGRRPAPPLP